jgi:hypothetical protein
LENAPDVVSAVLLVQSQFNASWQPKSGAVQRIRFFQAALITGHRDDCCEKTCAFDLDQGFVACLKRKNRLE